MTYRFYIWALLNFIFIKGIIDTGFNRFSCGISDFFLIILNFPIGGISLITYPHLYSPFIDLTPSNRFIIFTSEGIIIFILGYIQWFVLIPYLKEKRRKK